MHGEKKMFRGLDVKTLRKEAAVRSRVRPSLEFSIDINLPAAIWPLG
jgi:hypothetical protein